MKDKQSVMSQLKKFGFDPDRDKIVSDIGINKNHPYIENKANRSVETLKRVGLPLELTAIKKK